MWLWLTGIAHGACPSPTGTTAVARHVEAAEQAHVAMDEGGMRREREAAIQATLCLGELVHAPHAASLLRLEGLVAFADRNERFAVDVFRAALAVQPGFPLPERVAPPGGPVWRLYEQARAQPATLWTLPPSPRLVFVNGIASTVSPGGLSVLQVVEPDGRLTWTGLVTGPADLPPWFGDPVSARPPEPVAAAPAPEPKPSRGRPERAPPPPEPTPVQPAAPPVQPVAALGSVPPLDAQRRGSSAKLPLFASAGVGALAAGALFAGSAIAHQRYHAAPTADRRKATNAMYLGSVSAGIVSAGLFTVALALPGKGAAATDDDPGPVY